MVKAYLRYEFTGAFGVISSNASPVYDASGKNLFTGSLENVSLWNIKQGNLVRMIRGIENLLMYVNKAEF